LSAEALDLPRQKIVQSPPPRLKPEFPGATVLASAADASLAPGFVSFFLFIAGVAIT
jgi:hypothetical protein